MVVSFHGNALCITALVMGNHRWANNSALLACLWGTHRLLVDFPHKWPVMRTFHGFFAVGFDMCHFNEDSVDAVLSRDSIE